MSRSLELLLREIRAVKPLTEEEGRSLLMQWQAGDRQAGNRICLRHMPYVISVARRHRKCGVSLEDLVAEGACALFDAMRHYRPESEAGFLTYAGFWIRKRIMASISSQGMAIYRPRNRYVPMIFETIEHLELEDTNPDYTKRPPKLIAHKTEDPIGIESRSCRTTINKLLSSLSSRDRQIFCLRSGLTDGRSWMLREIAEEYGLTASAVSIRLRKIRRDLMRRRDLWKLRE